VLANGARSRPAARAREIPDDAQRPVQVDVDVAVGTLDVELGTPATADLAIAAVSTTLDPVDGTMGPRVWVRLPAAWLAASGVTGPLITEADTTGDLATAWDGVCDYATNTIAEFLALQSSRDVWLYDRGTTMYRGYARRGDQVTLESAYRETAIYRAGITGTGTATRIGVPTAGGDLASLHAEHGDHYLDR
jgi:hypothetical protein